MSQEQQDVKEIDVMDDKEFRTELLTLLRGIDWKLWEIYQISKQFED